MIYQENESHHSNNQGASITSICDGLEKDGETPTTAILLEDSWGQAMLRLTNARRQELDQSSVEWDDACMIQAQQVARQNAEQAADSVEKSSFTLGDAETIKAALQEAGHEDCCGTFRITAKTTNLTMDESSVEALDTLEKSADLWRGLMKENAAKGGFAAVQQGSRVYWAGVFLRTFETMNNSNDNN